MREQIANVLWSAGLNAFSHPRSYAAQDWNEYRLKLADYLIEKGVTIPPTPNNTMQDDGESRAVLEGVDYTVNHVDAETITLTRRL